VHMTILTRSDIEELVGLVSPLSDDRRVRLV
jgi:hypothetical protein